MIPALLLSLALGQTYTAGANQFEPNELSSEAIFVAVTSCVAKALEGQERTPALGKQAAAKCGCLMDATRSNMRRGITPETPTPEQRRKCEPLEKAPAKPPEKKGKIGV